MVDLDGNTLLASFIDAHSHYTNSLMAANQVDVPAIVVALRNFRDTRRIPTGRREHRVKEGQTIYAA
jgi:predicted amidohydrolase YtcJ